MKKLALLALVTFFIACSSPEDASQAESSQPQESQAEQTEADLCPRIYKDSQRQAAVRQAAEAGRLVVLIRHATKGGHVDRPCPDPDQALTEGGFAQAEALRAHWQRLGMSFSPVLTSPYCRTLQTAETLVPDAEPIEADGLFTCEFEDLISQHKQEGSNLLLVTHSGCVGKVLGVEIPHTDPDYDAVAAFIDYDNPESSLGCALASDWDEITGQ
ncbi:MAG TPA: phosphoglycerate mutase family protein [Acidobacteriota bacterium]|nr:phosphoglycerate mutase family protein [Acidobacteriota bacterium]